MTACLPGLAATPDLFLPTSSPSNLYSADLDADGIVDVIIDSGHGLLSTFQASRQAAARLARNQAAC